MYLLIYKSEGLDLATPTLTFPPLPLRLVYWFMASVIYEVHETDSCLTNFSNN